ncbi:hypothetical protein BV898_05742 [Hypsibius exemplaris]|uniref:Uncharacterized protein n=1 Tax=Hypsibius exemplaris TaxID=2072580 RepID=A0A1W0WYC6_HYPEX|nr:hypothetical protein BV898_05742 [Hypsibius exemplaris]
MATVKREKAGRHNLFLATAPAPQPQSNPRHLTRSARTHARTHQYVVLSTNIPPTPLDDDDDNREFTARR